MQKETSEIQKEAPLGKNRTGIEVSPIDKRALIEGAVQSVPSMEGDEHAIDEARADYIEKHELVGSMPLPASVKGAAAAVRDGVKGKRATVLLDKMGERLAFERTGTRLYGALLAKIEASDQRPPGPSLAEVQKIHDDELAHFRMLRECMISLGADPTAMTPSADVVAVSSLGLLQVVLDPRMTVSQSLEAILTAELVDRDGWTVLVELAKGGGHDDLVERFGRALAEEDEHLTAVRRWVLERTLEQQAPSHAAAAT